MDPTKIELQKEVVRANNAKAAWDSFIGSYCQERRAQLQREFATCAIGDDDYIRTIKLGLSAIDGLEGHLMSYIETGKLAQNTLNKE